VKNRDDLLFLVFAGHIVRFDLNSKTSAVRNSLFDIRYSKKMRPKTPLRQSAGVMELWSNGVMKGPIQVGIRAFAFANTPTLQYSSTPKELAIFTGRTMQR